MNRMYTVTESSGSSRRIADRIQTLAI